MASEQIDASGDGASAGTVLRGVASVVALVAAVALVVMVVLVANSNRARDDALAQERMSYDIAVAIRALDSSMARAEAALGRFVISGDKGTGTQYLDEWRRAGSQIRRLEQLTHHAPAQAALVRQLGRLYAVRGRELSAPAANADFGRGWQALGLFNEAGKSPTIERIATLLQRIADNERATLMQRSAQATVSAERSNSLAALLSALGMVLGLGAIALGWLTIQAMAQHRAARRFAEVETERAETLEQAVAERTAELSAALERLRHEAATRAAAEAQLRQVQKMEAVGQLTGGIAHDFNNMLAVVVGGLDLARRRLSVEAEEVGRHIDNAMEGATRAAALTRRLLAFARAEPLLPAGVEAGTLIAGMSDLLDRTLGERIEVSVRIAPDPWLLWVDPHQFENALLNLAVNARDAMEGEGRLLIETANIHLRDGEVGDARGGDYVCITVADDGCGMSQAVLDRVFEPFFTTKPVGKGTGLGLSQIFGFVRQSRGEIRIESEVGAGTTVALYLPRQDAVVAGTDMRSEAPAAHLPEAGAAVRPLSILVVEDDGRVRQSTVSALDELGHRTIACASAEDALDMLGERGDIDLIITDVVMPGLTGPELIARVAPLYPGIGVLFVTGYVGERGDAEQFAEHELLRKPFTISALARAIGAAMARHERRAA